MKKTKSIARGATEDQPDIYTFTITSAFESDLIPYQKGLKALLALSDMDESLRVHVKYLDHRHEETREAVRELRDNFQTILEENNIDLDTDLL